MRIGRSPLPGRYKTGRVVERTGSFTAKLGGLLFVEAKRGTATPSDIKVVDYHAFTAACAYCVATGRQETSLDHDLGGQHRTVVGFSDASAYLIPFIPTGRGLAERTEYLELKSHVREIFDGLEYVKKHMTPPRELLEKTPSPRPQNRALPQNWLGD